MQETPQGATSAPKKPAKANVSPAALLLVVVLAAGIGAYAYWLDDVNGMFGLQAWNPGAVNQLIKDVARVSHSKENGSLPQMLEPTSFSCKKDAAGHVTGVRWDVGMGPQNRPPDQMLPAGEPKEIEVHVHKIGEKYFFVSIVKFADDTWGQIKVTRLNGRLVVSELPTGYGKVKPTKIF